VAEWDMVASRNVAIIELFQLFLDCCMSGAIAQVLTLYFVLLYQ
jgi:hypothetical protein